MLIAFHEKIAGWLTKLIVALLVFSFALWGINFYFTPDGVRNIAKVNDRLIPLQQYQRTFYNQRQQIKSILGDTAQIDDALIREQTLRQIINAELIDQFAYDQGLQISESNIRAEIKNIQAFQREKGDFDIALYKTSLSNYGMDPAYFEQQIRAEMVSAQLRSALTQSIFVTDQEIEQTLQERQQRRTISYAILSTASYLDEIEIDEQAKHAFYDTHKENYMEPEQLRIAFIKLDMEQLSAEIQFEEQDIKDYYAEKKEQFVAEEKRNIKQITAKVDASATDEQWAAARRNIAQAKKLIDQGMRMEEVIEHYNKQGVSNLAFNEYRAIKSGVMQEEIDAFLFTANEGDISDPIESEKGLYIVQVGTIDEQLQNNYENNRENVIKEYRRAQAETQFFEQLDTMSTLAYEHQETLQPVAAATGLTIQETDFFSKKGNKDGILTNEALIDISFSDDIKENKINSDVIELSDTVAVVLRVIEQKQAKLKPLAEIDAQVTEDMKNEQAQKKAAAQSEAILAQLAQGDTMDAIAEQYQLEWTTKESVKKNNLDINRAILRAAFDMDSPKQGVQYTRTKIGASDYAIIALLEVEHMSSAQLDITVKERDALRSELEQRYARRDWEQLIDDIKEQSDIEIYKDNI